MNISDTSQRQERDFAESGSRRRKRRSKSSRPGSSQRGRIWLVVIFLVLRAIDTLMFFGTPPGDKSQLLASIITSGIWTTALLAAIWHRQNWARYIFIALQLLGVFSYVLFVPDMAEAVGIKKNYSLLIVFISAGLVNAGVAWCLISSPDIRRLTYRS